MKQLTLTELAGYMKGRVVQGDDSLVFDDAVIDSREAKAGAVFFPLIGEFQNGHKYIPQAVELGCRGVVVDSNYISEGYEKDKDVLSGVGVIQVEDTLKALQQLAKTYAEHLDLIKIAVTGSVGKTTTRDMIYAGMSSKYVTGKNKKNYNSESGLPLTVLSLTDDLEAAVLEMGMDGPGQIHDLVDIARPDVGVITNIGISHMERLGSRENIMKAKMEITDFFDENNTLVINSGDDMLKKADFGSYHIVKAGCEPGGDFVAKNIDDKGAEGIEFDLDTPEGTFHVNLPVPGAHNAVNTAIAVAACVTCGAGAQEAVRGIEEMTITGNRLRIVTGRGIKIIDDSYNAAPESMKSAIVTLSNTDGNRRVAVLGDMNELGAGSEEEHFKCGKFAGDNQIDLLIAIGEKGRDIARGGEESEGIQVMYFENKEALYDKIDDIFKQGDVVLVKASRTLQLEELAERILKG